MGNVNYTAQEGVNLLASEIGAWLADTSEGTVANNFVTNGDFTSSTSSWFPGNGATLASVSGELQITADGTATPYAWQQLTSLVVGRTYKYTATARRGTCASDVAIYAQGIASGTVTTSSTSNVTLSLTFTAITSTQNIYLEIVGATSAGETAYFDDVVLKETTLDLSATDIDLDVIGSPVKTAVATGAGLVGWGTFSTSNYLTRIYGADLDFSGTDTLSICAWVKTAIITGNQGICGNLSGGGSGDRGGYGLRLTGSKLEFAVSNAAGSLTQATDTVNFTANEWVFVCGTLSAAGAMLLYKNAVLADSAASASMDATAELFQVGVETSAGIPANAFAGEIALCKVYDVVLTAAQIKAIYKKEKDLFKAYAPFRQVGVAYDLDLSMSVANRSESVESTSQISLNGNQETTFLRRDTGYALNINRLSLSSLPAIRNFLHSVEAGQTFEFDRYGTASSPDDPVNVVAAPGFTESRNGVDDYYTITMNVREVP